MSLLHRLLSLDIETPLIAPGHLVPRPICAAVASVASDGIVSDILSRDDLRFFLRSALRSDKVFVGANIAFDFGCIVNEWPDLLSLVFDTYGEGRVVDVQILQALDAVARGLLGLDPQTGSGIVDPGTGKKSNRYSLATCVKQVLGRTDAKKNDAWRLSYALLDGTPLSRWPPLAVQYVQDDARNTLEVAVAQLFGGPGEHSWVELPPIPGIAPGRTACRHCGETLRFSAASSVCVRAPRRMPHQNIENLPDQAETAFDLHLGAVRGIRTDRARAEALREAAQKKRTVMTARYQGIGFLRDDGTENQLNVRKAVALAYGADPFSACERCRGTGKISTTKTEPCRGVKLRGRYQGCVGVSCICGGRGQVEKAGAPATCWASDGGCDGTGLDLSTASTLVRTETGLISISRDTLSESGDENLHDYGESEHDKVLDTYLPFVEKGFDHPINLRPNTVLETIRASYDGVIQLIPQKGGVRETFRARDGHVFCSVDYSALELCTLAQVCLLTVGHSRMAEVINETKDPGMLHTAFGARMVGVSVEQMAALVKAKDVAARNTRSAAKAGNFSFGGGAGSATTVMSNRAKAKGSTKAPDGFEYAGIRFCLLLDGADRCGEVKLTRWKKRDIAPTCARCLRVVEEVLRPSWYAEWPEMKPYFDWVSKTVGDTGHGFLPCFGRKFWNFDSERGFTREESSELQICVTRGGVSFTDGANGGFQTLAALGAKYALRRVTRECYVDEESPLFRTTRPIFFAHDEIFSEMLRHKAHLAGPRKAQVMREAMRVFVPDVHIAAEPAIMEFWSKDADTVLDADGVLQVWRPKS